MFERRRVYLVIVALLLLTGCWPFPDEQEKAAIVAVTPDGPVELKSLPSTEETAINCPDGIVEPFPSTTIVTSHAVEWETSRSSGAGLTIGSDALPGGLDLSTALNEAHGVKLDESRSSTSAHQLKAQPDTVARFTVRWTEEWQPGYVEVSLPNHQTEKVRVKYRTRILSNVERHPIEACGSGVRPTSIAEALPTPAQSEPNLEPYCSGYPGEAHTGETVTLDANRVYVLFHYPLGVSLGVAGLQFVTGVEVGSSDAVLSNYSGTIIPFDEACAGRIPVGALGEYTGERYAHAEYRLDQQGNFRYPDRYQNRIPAKSRLRVTGGPLSNVPLP